jgi:hypothetical protein
MLRTEMSDIKSLFDGFGYNFKQSIPGKYVEVSSKSKSI